MVDHSDYRKLPNITPIYYWRLVRIIGDYWRLLKITGDYWRLLEITGGMLQQSDRPAI